MKVKRIFNILVREFGVYYFARIPNLLPNNMITCKIRGLLVSPFFHTAGKNFQLAQGSIINYPEHIHLGENVYIAHRAYINARGGLQMGSNVTIGPNCIIATSNHSVGAGYVGKDGTEGPISIGDGTWIGGNVTITDGVKIGKNCIIGAGSTVTKDIPDNVMAVGLPAAVKKQLI